MDQRKPPTDKKAPHHRGRRLFAKLLFSSNELRLTPHLSSSARGTDLPSLCRGGAAQWVRGSVPLGGAASSSAKLAFIVATRSGCNCSNTLSVTSLPSIRNKMAIRSSVVVFTITPLLGANDKTQKETLCRAPHGNRVGGRTGCVVRLPRRLIEQTGEYARNRFGILLYVTSQVCQ